jgi:hypothetical protein
MHPILHNLYRKANVGPSESRFQNPTITNFKTRSTAVRFTFQKKILINTRVVFNVRLWFTSTVVSPQCGVITDTQGKSAVNKESIHDLRLNRQHVPVKVPDKSAVGMHVPANLTT